MLTAVIAGKSKISSDYQIQTSKPDGHLRLGWPSETDSNGHWPSDTGAHWRLLRVIPVSVTVILHKSILLPIATKYSLGADLASGSR